MQKAKTYQDLVCWQLAHELEVFLFEITETGSVARDFKFRDQIRDSSSSATRNMAEGFGTFWPREHARLLRIALGELTETHNSAVSGMRKGYFTAEQSERMQNLALRSKKAATSLVIYLDSLPPRPPGLGRNREP